MTKWTNRKILREYGELVLEVARARAHKGNGADEPQRIVNAAIEQYYQRRGEAAKRSNPASPPTVDKPDVPEDVV